MPQIRRIRIVNISYNNGNRLIPDELFDLRDENDRSGLNTLISLINGGGKSVLVQMMMQPVLPRAHASSRRIEEFFTRSGDHGFILLEWMLEDSDNRLLTGIAISAAGPNDESRGRNIKYYTFYSIYTQDSAKYSIVNLELSSREGSRFVPAEFDFVRKLANRSNHELQSYSDRENSEWKSFLEQYGILQEQWRTLMEKLNSSENGMTGYFEKFKTSDQLIDGLLIPAVEAHLTPVGTEDEGKLSAVMLGYLQQYRTNEKRVLEREVCRRFSDAITERQKDVQRLWNKDDEHNHAVGELFGFQAALASELSALEQYTVNLTQQQKEAENDMYRIGWEEASEQFWKAKEAAKRSAEALRKAQENVSLCTASIEKTKQETKRMQAAKYAGKYWDAKCSADACLAQIKEKEQGSDAQQLKILGANIHRILKTELPVLRDTVVQLRQDAEAAGADLQQAQKKERAAEQNERKFRTERDKKDGELTQYKRETDTLVQRLRLDIHRNLIQVYVGGELQRIAVEKSAEQQRIIAQKIQLDEDLQKVTDRIEQIPTEQAKQKILLELNRQQLEKLQTEWTKYQETEEQLREICKLHSLDFAQRFTSAVSGHLQEKLREAKSEQRQAERRLEQKAEELSAAKAGTLHIPQTVLRWLDQIDVDYQTCERYLLDCELSAEQIAEILGNCPVVAYGILVKKEEKQRLLETDRPDWLPSVLPVFTMEEMRAILQLRHAAPDDLLAYYAQGYFADHTGFVQILQKEKEDISSKTDAIKERIKRLEGELQIVTGFQYEENWLVRKEQEIHEQNALIEDINRQLSVLTQESDELKTKRGTLRKQIEEIEKAIDKMTRFLEDLQSLQSRIEQEETLYNAYEAAHQAFSDCEKELQAARNFTKNCAQKKQDTEDAVQQSSSLLSEMENAWTETQNYIDDTIIKGDWQTLYQQFQRLCETQDESIRILRTRLQTAQEKMREAQVELSKTGCQPEEYANIVYSEQAEVAVKDELERLEAEQKTLHRAETDWAARDGKEQSALGQAEQNLSRYGEPLAQSQIVGDYQNRKKVVQLQIADLKRQILQTENKQKEFERVFGKTEEVLRDFRKPGTVPKICPEADIGQQWDRLRKNESCLNNQLTALHTALLEELRHLLTKFENTAEAKAISMMVGLMQQEHLQGDRYMTLDDQMTASIESTKKRVVQIDTELDDFDNTKHDLVHQCVLQGRQIYQGLQTIMKNSRIQAYEDMRKEMLKMELPKEIDEKLSDSEIEAEIDRAAQEIIRKLEHGELTEAELKQRAENAVSSRHLLRKYIRKESIEVWAYKVDANRSHAEYRRWKDIPHANSGAERFLVYFAVIVLLMDYSGSEAGLRADAHTNVLILDNPFAVITSAHVLEPMFRMAKQFRIQLICLSDITKCDITNCFELHIKAAVRQNMLSGINILSHEGNEQIEHGFYRARQLTLS